MNYSLATSSAVLDLSPLGGWVEWILIIIASLQVEAVDYIHTKLHCIHRDLKPDNIIFDKEATAHLRVTS